MTAPQAVPRSLGRYTLYDEIAAGGMATVHIGRLLGPAGFSRTVAVKCLHPQFAKDPEFVSMFLDEARLAARIRHPNVVSTLDVVARDGELFLVMEYVQGMSLSALAAAARSRAEKVPQRIASAILIDTLLGLQAAHDARNDRGDPLGIVHRDISPQNVLVGADGVARVVDFGVAKAAARAQTTREGQLKGKLAYMSPEQLQLVPLDGRSDVFAASVVLWELLAGRRLFAAAEPGAILTKILTGTIEAPSTFDAAISPELDAVVLRGLARDRSERFGSAKEMARALQAAVPRADALEVGDWIASVAAETLERSCARLASIEEASSNALVSERPGPPSIKTAVAAPPGSGTSRSISLGAGPMTGKDSGITELSASRSHPVVVSRPWRSRAVWIAAGAMFWGVLALLGYASPQGKTVGAGAPETPPSVEPSVVAKAAAPAVKPASELAADVIAEPMPAPARDPAPHKPASSKRSNAKSTATAARVSLKVATASCNPPFTLKPDGSKRFKPECF